MKKIVKCWPAKQYKTESNQMIIRKMSTLCVFDYGNLYET